MGGAIELDPLTYWPETRRSATNMCVCKLLVLKEVVGAIGFEPTASWSRTNHVNPITLYFGVAYGTRSVISPLLVVPKLVPSRFSEAYQFRSSAFVQRFPERRMWVATAMIAVAVQAFAIRGCRYWGELQVKFDASLILPAPL